MCESTDEKRESSYKISSETMVSINCGNTDIPAMSERVQVNHESHQENIIIKMEENNFVLLSFQQFAGVSIHSMPTDFNSLELNAFQETRLSIELGNRETIDSVSNLPNTEDPMDWAEYESMETRETEYEREIKILCALMENLKISPSRFKRKNKWKQRILRKKIKT